MYYTVVQQLSLRADRKFIIVEMVFFSRWFNEASDAERDAVRAFVANGKVRHGRTAPSCRGCARTERGLARHREAGGGPRGGGRSSLSWEGGA